MIATDDLLSLIQSLNQTEKRYFKIFAQRHVIGKSNAYINLFDAVDAAGKKGNYDESEIRKQLNKIIPTTSFAVVKNYLYNLILKSMRAYHEDDNETHAISLRLLDIEFLMQKGLYDKALKLLKTIKQSAHALNRNFMLIEILSLQRRLMRHTLEKSSENTLQKSSEEEMACLQNITLELKYHHLYDQLFVMLQQYYQFRDERLLNKVQKIMKNPLLANSEQATTFEATIMYHLIHSDHAHLIGDAFKSKYHRHQIMVAYEAYPKMQQDESLRYLNSLNNYLTSCFQINDLEQIAATLEKIKSIIPTNLEEESQIFKNSTYLELLFYIQTNRFADAQQLVPVIESGLKKFGSKLPKGRILTIYYNVAVLFFVTEAFDECLTWINKIIFGDWENIRQDIQDSAKIIQIIVHFELGNIELLESLMRSTRRHLKETNRLYEVESLLLQLMKKLLRSPGKKERGNALQAAQLKLQQLISQSESAVTGTDEVQLWLDSRIKNKKISEIMIK